LIFWEGNYFKKRFTGLSLCAIRHFFEKQGPPIRKSGLKTGGGSGLGLFIVFPPFFPPKTNKNPAGRSGPGLLVYVRPIDRR